MQYLYTDGEFWHFMMPDNFEQYTAGKEALGDGAIWLKDGMSCTVMLWNGEPLNVTPPAHVELKVIETDPGLRGDTATGGGKPAKLETGADGSRAAVHQRRRVRPRRHSHGRVHRSRQSADVS